MEYRERYFHVIFHGYMEIKLKKTTRPSQCHTYRGFVALAMWLLVLRGFRRGLLVVLLLSRPFLGLLRLAVVLVLRRPGLVLVAVLGLVVVQPSGRDCLHGCCLGWASPTSTSPLRRRPALIAPGQRLSPYYRGCFRRVGIARARAFLFQGTFFLFNEARADGEGWFWGRSLGRDRL